MKKILTSLLVLFSMTALCAALPTELQEYKLDNGLTVILWEDHDQPDVEGYVVVRAGAVDEPAEYTGLAHYLEHMHFKGTQRIGALDWEKEKPIYDSIIALYDEYSDATDPKERERLATAIRPPQGASSLRTTSTPTSSSRHHAVSSTKERPSSSLSLCPSRREPTSR